MNPRSTWDFLRTRLIESVRSRSNTAFSHDVVAAILAFQTTKQWPYWCSRVELFSLCKRSLLFDQICTDDGHMSENTRLNLEVLVFEERGVNKMHFAPRGFKF